MTSSKDMPVGIILAGGLSRRMGGQEKSFIELAGKPLIAHVSERLSQQTDQLIINANGDPARFSQFKLPVIRDTIEGFAGPLAGVLSAMVWAKEHTPNIANIITAAADTPFFPMALVKKLNQHANGKDAIVFANSNGRRHPVFGLWPVALASQLEDFLVKEEGRKVVLFAERYQLHEVEFDNLESEGQTLDPFFNINEPQDLELASAMVNSAMGNNEMANSQFK